ncbi:TonB-dependent receptor domain-containing protein [Sphingomonas sp. UNC305MFCol5.2]|uniref:TonB-dependent receptor domain-containing protein n=1 Tax=Sphingomonas sp. UNC305MFCol5.2 TaxID=1449076 RepID=UPI001E2EF093|nr:TonB-dependent receptor [Sphingomonas sp. UNC305MFCol5.2]
MSRLNRLLLSTTCFAGMFAAPAMAQEADTPTSAAAAQDENAGEVQSGDIIVTGSRITRPNMTAAAPITSVTSESIRAQAAVNIEEVLNRIPQIAPDSQQNYQDSDGRQRVKLRNLGFERTLTLIDGKRVGTMNGVDVNMIPTALIQRVDVLTGGASAVYGSDAVAGVVNFIMKNDFEGIQLNANYNFYAHDNQPGLVSQVASRYGFGQPSHGLAVDGGRVDLSLTAGTKLFDDRFRVSGYVNYRKGELVPNEARETAGCQLIENVKDGPLACSTSTYSYHGYVSPRTGANNGNQYVNNPDGSRTFVPFSDAVAANPYSDYSFQRGNERWNAGGFASFEISDAAELYASGMWFHDKSANGFPARIYSYTAFGSAPYQVNCNNPFLSASQAQVICGAQAGTNAMVPIELRYRFSGVPDLEDRYLNEGLRITGGVRGDFAEGWSYDVGGVYARNQQDWSWSFPSVDRVNNALNVVSVGGVPTCASGAADGCLPLDPFSSRSTVNNSAVFDYLVRDSYGTQSTVNKLYNVLATVQGDLGTYGIKSPWAEQGVAIAFGAEFREDRLEGTADQLWRDNMGGTDQSLSQHVWEGNVELQVPIAQHKPFADLLQFNGAYRLSKYSSNPEKFSTWKAEALWAPIPDITFRGSINRAQRAPTVVEAYQGSNISYDRITTAYNDICAPTRVGTTTDPNTGQQVPVYGAPQASQAVCAATGLAANLYGSPTLLCPTDVGCTVRRGGFTVDPETAYTKTFGVVLRPRFLPGLTLSADRFMIDLNDSIGYNDYDYFSNGCLATGNDFFCRMFVRNANGTLYSAPAGNPSTGYLRGGTTNYYKSKSHGWDFQGQYALPLGGAGRLDFDFMGSLTTLAGGQDSPILPKYNCAGYYGGGCGQLIPKWTHALRTTYTTADQFFSASVNWRHLGPLTNVTNSGDPALGWTAAGERATFYRIDPYDYIDLALSFRVNKAYSFRISANNLFDKTPPILPNSYNYGLSRSNTLSARYDSLGRQIAVGATLNF